MQEEHLIREFIAEAEEHLLALEPNLLRLEKDPHNHELMNEIFLATHNIKGTASYVGLSHISEFTHTLESLLDQLRKGQQQASSDLIDVLLEGMDMLKRLIQHIALHKPAPETSMLIKRLRQWQSDSESSEPQSSEASAVKNSSTPTNAGFDPAALHLEPEDCEIFADIANQQLELIHFSLDKIQAIASPDDSDSQAQLQEAMNTLRQTFHKIQSSAAMLNVDELDTILAEYAQGFSPDNDQAAPLNEQQLSEIHQTTTRLTDLIAAITSYSRQQLSEPPSQETVSSSPRALELPLSEPLQESSMLRIHAERIDDLLNLVGELVINRARLVQIGDELKTMYEDIRTGELHITRVNGVERKKHLRSFKKLKEHFDEITSDLGRLTNQMQESTMRIRMVPIGQVVNRFPRMVRDLSRQAEKSIEIRIYGADTELDKTVIDIIGDPLIHLIRNAIDHGIESPAERAAKGKPSQGTITLSAYHEGNQVIIDIADDGKGLDLQRIKEQALQQRLLRPQDADTLDDRTIASLIFHSGFSTVQTVSSLSGRGVGLSVVKRYLEKMNGAVEFEFSPDQGCKFTIKLPLTLAIIPALLVMVRSEIFAIPLMSVEEAIRIQRRDINTIKSHDVIHLRDRIIPLFDLADLFGAFVFQPSSSKTSASSHASEHFYGVILSDGFREIALVVDALCGESDIVIKSLKDDLVNVEGISGASIQGDGRVALVIDAVSLINLAIQHLRRRHRVRSQSKSKSSLSPDGHGDQHISLSSNEDSPIAGSG